MASIIPSVEPVLGVAIRRGGHQPPTTSSPCYSGNLLSAACFTRQQNDAKFGEIMEFPYDSITPPPRGWHGLR